jgi:hypothetical protein
MKNVKMFEITFFVFHFPGPVAPGTDRRFVANRFPSLPVSAIAAIRGGGNRARSGRIE